MGILIVRKGKVDEMRNLKKRNIKEKKVKPIEGMKQPKEIKQEGKKTRNRKFTGIRLKLTFGFLVPISFMVCIGVISYLKSSKAMIESYENSTKSTIDMAGDYYDLILSNVKATSFEMVMNEQIQKYYSKYYKDDTFQEITAHTNNKKNLQATLITDKFLYDIIMFGEYGNTLYGSVLVPNDLYEDFIKTEEASKVDEKGNAWVGYHKYLDEHSKTDPKKYGMSIVRQILSSNFKKVGYVFVDVKLNAIEQVLKDINLGDRSIIALITPDGREISYVRNNKNEEEAVDADLPIDEIESNLIYGQEFYNKAIESYEQIGSDYVDMNGKSYLFIYKKLNEEGFMTCALVPKSEIVKEATSLATLTFLIVSISVVVALIIALVLSSSIGNTIQRFMSGIGRVSQGDLTIEIKTNRKDELGALGGGIMNMLSSVKEMLSKSMNVTYEVNGSSEKVAENSQLLLTATKGITQSITEIEQGILQQAKDSEKCLVQMDQLSEKINIVSDSTNNIATIAEGTTKIVKQGIHTVDELDTKAKDTTDITRIIIKNIEQLEISSNSIDKIVGGINDIADQTNLLSLNASIEAARAGDSGRGFAVVADEIRKLAEQSVAFVNEIKLIVEDIKNKTKETVVTTKKAENIVVSQGESLRKTVEIFNSIEEHVSILTNNLEQISDGVKNIERTKRDTLIAIESISAVSEETAAATEEVNDAASKQLNAAINLSQEADELTKQSQELANAIRVFKI